MKPSSIVLLALAASALAAPAFAGTCRDPWVTQAIQQVTGHAPRGSGESMDCSIRNYGGGSWSSYPDLVNKVRVSYRDPMGGGFAGGGGPIAGQVNGGYRPGGGAGLVTQGGGNMVAAGGGNMVAAGGGNMVAAGGGN